MAAAPLTALLELDSLVSSVFGQNSALLARVLLLLCVGGTISLVLVLLELRVVQLTSSLTLSVLGNVKEAVQIMLYMTIDRDRLTLRSLAGISLALLSAQYYNCVHSDEPRGDDLQTPTGRNLYLTNVKFDGQRNQASRRGKVSFKHKLRKQRSQSSLSPIAEVSSDEEEGEENKELETADDADDQSDEDLDTTASGETGDEALLQLLPPR